MEKQHLLSLFSTISSPVKKQFKGQYGDSVGKEYLSLHPELGLETWPEPPSNPSAAKFLRF